MSTPLRHYSGSESGGTGIPSPSTPPDDFRAYAVRHVTAYEYDEQVPLSHNILHLRPREMARQRCRWAKLTIDPTPSSIFERTDFFGNRLDWISVERAHGQLQIDATCEVEIHSGGDAAPARRLARAASALDAGVSWESVAALLADNTDTHASAASSNPPPQGGAWEPGAIGGTGPGSYASTREARPFRFDSPQVPREKSLAAYARPSFPPGRGVYEASLDLTRRIHREFTFDPEATTVGSPVLQVLRLKRGVCQDFAHLMLACLRSMGLAARYVSGYLLTHPPPGKPRLVGADASHAWVSVWGPTAGWIDFDPTNGIVPDLEHITIGWARDFDDISPARGVIVGGATHRLRVSVDVTPLDTPPPAPDPINTPGTFPSNGHHSPTPASNANGHSSQGQSQY